MLLDARASSSSIRAGTGVWLLSPCRTSYIWVWERIGRRQPFGCGCRHRVFRPGVAGTRAVSGASGTGSEKKGKRNGGEG